MNRFRLRPEQSQHPRVRQRNAIDARARRVRSAGERDLAQDRDRYANQRPNATGRVTVAAQTPRATPGQWGLASATALLAIAASPPAQAKVGGSRAADVTKTTNNLIDLLHPPAPHAGLSAHDIDGNFERFGASPAYCADARAVEAEIPADCGAYDMRDLIAVPVLGISVTALAAWRVYQSRWVYPAWKTRRLNAALARGLVIASHPHGLNEYSDRCAVQAHVDRAHKLTKDLIESRLWRNTKIKNDYGGWRLYWDVALRGGLLLYWQGVSSGHDLLGNYFMAWEAEARRCADLDMARHLAERFAWTHALLRDALPDFLAEHPDYNNGESLRWFHETGTQPLAKLMPSTPTISGADRMAFWDFAEERVRAAEESRRAAEESMRGRAAEIGSQVQDLAAALNIPVDSVQVVGQPRTNSAPEPSTSAESPAAIALQELLPSGDLRSIARSGILTRERRTRIAALDATLASWADRTDLAAALARMRVVREAMLAHGSEPNELPGRVAELSQQEGSAGVATFGGWLTARVDAARAPFAGVLAELVSDAYAALPPPPTTQRSTDVYANLNDATQIVRQAVARAVTFFVGGVTLSAEPPSNDRSGGATTAETENAAQQPRPRLGAERFGRGGTQALAASTTLEDAAHRLAELQRAREAAILRMLAAYFGQRRGEPDHQLPARVAALDQFPNSAPQEVVRWLEGLHAVEAIRLDGPRGAGTGPRLDAFENSPLADLADAMREAALPHYSRMGQVLDFAATARAEERWTTDAEFDALYADLTQARQVTQVAVETAAHLLARAESREQHLAARTLQSAVTRLSQMNEPAATQRLSLVAQAVTAHLGRRDVPIEATLRAYLDAHPGQGPKEIKRWLDELHVLERARDRPSYAAFVSVVERTLIRHLPNFADLADPATAPEAQRFALPEEPLPSTAPVVATESWVEQPLATALRAQLEIDWYRDPRCAALRADIQAIAWADVPDAAGKALGRAIRGGALRPMLTILHRQFGIASAAQILALLDTGGQP